MFRQSGNGPSDASKSGELLVTKGSGGTGADVNLIEVGGAAIALGQTTSANSLPVVIASDQSAIAVTASFTPTGTQDVNLTKVGGAAVALGQAAMAASMPVVLASNQTAVPISAASLPLPTGAATAALQTQPGVDIGDVTVNNGSGAAAVNVQDGGNTLTVDGTVAVTQGTASSLNATVVGTGTFAVQDAAAEASLSVLDDWDESDRAKVNPIVGQAGIAGNAGEVGVTTVRTIAAIDTNLITRRDNYTGAQTDTAIVSVSTGTKIVCYSCTVAADAANTAKPAVRVGFGATNTPTAAGTYLSHPGVPAGGGIRQAGAVEGGDGEDLRITCAAPTGGSIDVVTVYRTI